MNRSTLATAIILALALAALPASRAAAEGAGDGPPTQREIERIVKHAQDEAHAAIERARQGVAAQGDAMRAQQHALTAQADVLAQVDLDFDLPTLAFFGNEFGAPREIVKNAPYTADAVNETVQVLADGNRIVKRSVTRLARDTVGRTRQEKTGARGATVYLFDPIDDRNYALDPQRKVAVRIPRVPAPPVPPAPVSEPALPGAPAPGTPLLAPTAPTPPTAPPTAPAAPTPPTSSAYRGPSGAAAVAITEDGKRVYVRRGGDGGGPDDVQVEIIRIGGDDRTSLAALPPITMPVPAMGKGEQKSLGTRDFDGVKAQGTQTTHTIAAGTIGNEKPIVVTRERWFSAELQLVVFVRNADPRTGETTYRLTNLRRGEPPADLFRVPADFRTRRDARG